MTARAHGALALAEVAVPELPRPTAPFLVLMLDRSGSMAGTRTSNMLRGVRALLKLLAAHVPDARVALVGFHAAARVVFGAGSPADALGAWAEIELALYPAGGTDLAAALREGLRVALGSEGRAATLLLLTDGQDPSLGAALLSSPRGEEELDFEPALRVSGIALHLVGICSDADAAVLETLGARTGGTFTCIDDTDIQGLMGSLLGLVLDQLPQAARLTITAASGASGASGGAAEKEIVVLLPERAVILRSGATVRVPFELIGAFGVEGADVVTIDMRLRLVRVGTVDETEHTFETRVALAATRQELADARRLVRYYFEREMAARRAAAEAAVVAETDQYFASTPVAGRSPVRAASAAAVIAAPAAAAACGGAGGGGLGPFSTAAFGGGAFGGGGGGGRQTYA